MIGSIQGKITLIKDRFVIIEANNIGYKVYVSPETIVEASKKLEVLFWIHSHVREDSFDLYGFLEYDELEFFEMLINVSGIGPKGALTILGVASIDTLKKAIQTGDIAYLTKISGIGKKTAEKMLIELRDKISKDTVSSGSLKHELDALEALKALGYSQNEAREALKNIPSEADTNTKIREALRTLGGK